MWVLVCMCVEDCGVIRTRGRSFIYPGIKFLLYYFFVSFRLAKTRSLATSSALGLLLDNMCFGRLFRTNFSFGGDRKTDRQKQNLSSFRWHLTYEKKVRFLSRRRYSIHLNYQVDSNEWAFHLKIFHFPIENETENPIRIRMTSTTGKVSYFLLT